MSTPVFRRGAVKPIACFREGWALIRERYWLFFGIAVVGMLIASMVPMAILLGPMMCGIHICLFRQERGKEVKFDMLFRGFEHFGQSLIATLIMVVPMMLIGGGGYLALIVGMMTKIGNRGPNAPPPNQGEVMEMFIVIGVFVLFFMILSYVLSALWLFVYPLLVDRKMSGMDAVKTSIRAAFGNFVGVFTLVFLQMLMSFVGVLFCYVGALFVLPLHFATVAIAYRQVFPDDFAFEDEYMDDVTRDYVDE